MNFTDKILKQIIVFGVNGKSFRDIAIELNMTPDQLRDEQTKDEKLNDALTRAEFNRDQFMIDELEKDGIKKGSFIQKDVYKRLILKHNKGTDNKLEIEYV